MERTLETLGGSRKMSRSCSQGEGVRWALVGWIFIQFIQSRLLLTPAQFREGTRAGSERRSGHANNAKEATEVPHEMIELEMCFHLKKQC